MHSQLVPTKFVWFLPIVGFLPLLHICIPMCHFVLLIKTKCFILKSILETHFILFNSIFFKFIHCPTPLNSFKFIHLLAFSNCTLSQIVQLPLHSYIGSISQVHLCLTSSNHLTSPNSFIHVHPCLPLSNCLNSSNLITWVHIFSWGCPDPLTSSIISLLKIHPCYNYLGFINHSCII